MYIKELSTSGLSKGKVRVCLEGGTDFVLYNKEVNRYNLKEDTELTDATFELLLSEVFIPRAKKRAMHLLEQMDRTEKQLRDKLKDNGYPDRAIDEAISYVASYHYIDDERYARTYVRTYQDSRTVRRITQDLMQKGIDKNTIALAVDEEYTESEEEQIKKLLVKKKYDASLADGKEKDKMYRFLMQRGFKTSDISRALSIDE